jgi:hypothetical protein
MWKWLRVLPFIFASALFAQPSNPTIIWVSSAPSGACTNGSALQAVVSTGALYSCQSSTWAAISGGGGGGDTITSPNGTLSIGGSSTNTTLDFNLANANTWTGIQTVANGNGTATFGGPYLGSFVVSTGIGAKFQGVNSWQAFKDGTPTFAYGMGYVVPGGSAGNNPILSIYNGTTWNAALTFTSSSLAAAFAGAVTAPSFNGVTLTVPASGSTLTIANGKTLTASNSITLAGTDATTMTFPNSSDTVVTLGATQTLTNKTINASQLVANSVTATQLAAQYSKGSCTEAWGGSGTSFALTAGDDAIVNNTCYNDSGATRTITAVKCRSDIASNTTTVNPVFGASGSGTTVLSGALTCGSSLAYSSTGTVTNASWTTGTGINPVMGGTLTGTSIAVIVEYTF